MRVAIAFLVHPPFDQENRRAKEQRGTEEGIIRPESHAVRPLALLESLAL